MTDAEIERLIRENAKLSDRIVALERQAGALVERVRLVEDTMTAVFTSVAGMLVEVRDGILRSSPIARDGDEGPVEAD